jgi:hypothetical protein
MLRIRNSDEGIAGLGVSLDDLRFSETVKRPAPPNSSIYCRSCANPMRPDERSCRECGTPNPRLVLTRP